MPRKYDKNIFNPKYFHLEFLTEAQNEAYELYKKNDILFLVGVAGVGKSYLAIAFAVRDILDKNKSKLILSRPVVEAGESLGFLPGDMDEKVYPYMLPLYDSLDKICGKDGENREYIGKRCESAPIAFLRGRAQPLDAMIMTPNGPKTMGDMVIGSSVLGVDGQAHTITEIYPQGIKDIYKISFSDGTWTECCDEHLWATQTLSEKRYNKKHSVKTLTQIMGTLSNEHQKNHRIPVNAAVNFNKKETPINPYLLGLLLGDGSLHESACVSFSTNDIELVESISSILPDKVYILYSGKYDWRLTSMKRKINPIKQALRDLELLGKNSENKFVPDMFKFNDYDTRLAVLRGLMDTDGTVWQDRKTTRAQYYSTSETLAKDVVFLVQSLGGIAYIRRRDFDESDDHYLNGRIIRHTKSCWIVEIVMETNPFQLTRKASKFIGRKPIKLISNVELIGTKACQCIKIDSEDHLYLTDNFIVTHNTFDDSVCILDEAQNCTKVQLKLFLTRLGNNSKMIITGDPTQTDLTGRVTSGLNEVIDKLSDVKNIGIMEFTEETIVRHPLIAEIIKRI